MEIIKLNLEHIHFLDVKAICNIFDRKTLRWKREIVLAFPKYELDRKDVEYSIGEIKKNKYFLAMKKILNLDYPCIFYFRHPDDY